MSFFSLPRSALITSPALTSSPTGSTKPAATQHPQKCNKNSSSSPPIPKHAHMQDELAGHSSSWELTQTSQTSKFNIASLSDLACVATAARCPYIIRSPIVSTSNLTCFKTRHLPLLLIPHFSLLNPIPHRTTTSLLTMSLLEYHSNLAHFYFNINVP